MIELDKLICAIQLHDLIAARGICPVFDSEGRQRRTLLVAIDGEQVVDFESPISDGAREITLMPPIAGG